jgi:uncharacterized membrane protein
MGSAQAEVPPILVDLLAAAGVLLMAVAVPLMLRRVPPNGWYGVRLPATLADRAVWYDANARSGRDLFVLGGLFTALVLGLPRVAPGVAGLARILVPMGAMSIGTIVVLVRAMLHAERLLAARRGPPAPRPPP